MKNLKLSTIFIVLQLLLFQGFAQTTFHKQINTDLPRGILTSVFSTDSCFYVTGVVRDSISPNPTGNIFSKISLDGNQEFRKILAGPNETYQTWAGELQNTSDGNLINIGYYTDTTVHTIIIKFNPEGDTLWTKKYEKPFQSNFYSPSALIKNHDNGYAMVIGHNPMGSTDFSLLVLDSLFQEKHFFTFGGGLTEISRSLIALENGNYIIGANQTNSSSSTNPIRRAYIVEVDTLGEVIWEYISPSSQYRDKVYKMIPTEDGGIVGLSGIGFKTDVNSSTSIVNYHGSFFKLDANHEIEWETMIEGIIPAPVVKLEDFVAAPDGSGYVAAGRIAENHTEPEGIASAHIVKISPEGDSLWNRFYNYLDGVSLRPEPYDIKATADGGYIVVGRTRVIDTLVQVPSMCWLLKVDEYGCLVPGCQDSIINTSTEVLDIFVQTKIYPNPTSDFLNVFVRQSASNGTVNFRIIDITGQEKRRFVSRTKEETLIINIQDLASGIYFFEVTTQDGERKVEQFVVE